MIFFFKSVNFSAIFMNLKINSALSTKNFHIEVFIGTVLDLQFSSGRVEILAIWTLLTQRLAGTSSLFWMSWRHSVSASPPVL